MRISGVAVLLLIGSGTSLLAQTKTGGTTRLPRGPEPVVTSSDSARVQIVKIGEEDVRGRSTARFASFDETGGMTVVLELWAAPEGSEACVLVNARGEAYAHAFCSPVEAGSGQVTLRRVVFGEGFDQMGEFTIRSGVYSPAPPKEVNLEEWLKRSLADLDLKQVTIARRALVDEGPNGVTVATVGGVTVDNRGTIVAEPSSTITGTWRHPNPPHCRDWNGNLLSVPCVVLLVHAVGSGRWRVLANAEVSGHTWTVRDARIAEPGEPLQALYEIVPILSIRPKPVGPVDPRSLDSGRQASGASVRIVIQDHSYPLPLQPEIRLTGFVTRKGRKTPSGDSVLRLGREALIEVECEAARLPLSASLWAAVVDHEGGASTVDGPALLAEDRWRIKLSKGAQWRLAHGGRLYAFVTTAKDLPPHMQMEAWRQQSAGTSLPIEIEADGAADNLVHPEISLTGINGTTPSSTVPLDVRRVFQAEGTVDAAGDDWKVCLAFRHQDQERWTVRCDATTRDDHWTSPTIDLAAAASPDRLPPGTWDLVAFLTSRVPPPSLPLEQLADYSENNTAQYHISVDSATDHGTGGWPLNAGPPVPPTWSLCLFVCLLLATVEYLCRGVSTLAGTWAERLESATRGYRSAFAVLRRTDYNSGEVRGLMFVIVGVAAMFAYYPMYRDALRQVFSLSLAGAGALALTLIIFNGSAGAIFEAALDGAHGLARVFTATLFLTVMACFWTFQSAMYFLHYMAKSGSQPKALTMALAAFFMAAIESGIFFYGFRKGDALITAGVVQIFKSPGGILAFLLFGVKAFFLCIPSRADKLNPDHGSAGSNSDKGGTSI